MTPPIAIHFGPGYFADPRCAAVLVEACSQGSRGDDCVRADGGLSGQVRALAVVESDLQDERRVRISVALPNGSLESLRTQELVFRPDDPFEDRCRATGLGVAAAVLGRGTAVAPDAVGTALARDGASLANHVPRGGPFVLVSGLLGQGTQGGPLRTGGAALAGYQFARVPWFGLLSASYAQPVRDVAPGLSVAWVSVGCGVGIGTSVADWRLSVRLRLEGFVEATRATWSESFVSTTGQVWVPGTRAGVDLVWPIGEHTSLVFGMDAIVRSHPVVIRWSGSPAATTPAGGYSGFLGLQFDLGG